MQLQGNGLTNSLFDLAPVGSRNYQILAVTPGSAPVAALPPNGSFELGSGTTASNWVLVQAVGGPVYAERTNDNPHSGSFNFEVYLASTGAGPVVEVQQSGLPLTGGTTYPFSFYADEIAGAAGCNPQWRVIWNTGGDTGFHTFAPGNNQYGVISNSVTAPAGATSATLDFYFAGAADPGQSATIQLDDVAFGAAGGTGSPGQTNILAAAVQPVSILSWPTLSGIQYQPQSTFNLASGMWTSISALIMGDGTVKSFMVPMTNNAVFFRLQIPPVVVQPPTGLYSIPTGSTNSIGLAWTPSASLGVTGYRVLYGVDGGSVTNTIDLGNVTSAIISGLTAGQSYFVSVITLSSNGPSDPGDATITAQPDTGVGIVSLYNASTPLEPDTISNTPTALITWIADRPRARHARESQFMLYDTYLPFYWEQRMTTIQIIDTIAKGGSTITFNMTTLNGLDTPNIRFFFLGQTTVAEYNDNLYAGQVDPSLTNWTTTISRNTIDGHQLTNGDRVEFEFSPFMLTVSNGQLNYYGGAILYKVGQGIVPWQEGVTNDYGPVNAAIDSTPMPTNGWLAGGNTLPYQYSADTNHWFNQMTPNASPPTGEPFMLGRRLHHTSFLDGTHSEPGNPVFTEMIGKIGPHYSNVSCDACHSDNGRALPPALGAPMLQSLIRVGSDASGTPDPVLGSVLQQQATNGAPLAGVSIGSFTTINGTYGDGTVYTLQKPNYVFTGHTPTFYSVRLAPQLVGMGLLEAVSESTIEALAISETTNSGINGRLQIVTDPRSGLPRLGRFGYKAGRASVSQQIAGALNSDMGVTTSVFPVRNGETNSGPPELADSDLTNWTRYVSALGVNARRNLTDPQALLGEQLFASANCVACHTPTLTTSPYHPMAELRNQVIHPYTDLLLHDMGPGLADNMGEDNATGSQWRTPPLWSIGFTPGVSGGEAYLHDGRARSLEEAILWHGGEAEASEETFRNMSATDRAALVAFLKSL
jgi:CxxC motif-containing protein (DUF1111 family)